MPNVGWRKYVNDRDLILSNVCIDQNTGCWNWQGCLLPSGYGHIGIRRDGRDRTVMAHRVSYATFVAPIPDGLGVLHRCDNRKCANPEHLWLGTRADNMRDCAQKGRTARGSRHSAAALTEDEVVELRNIYAAGGISQRALGQRFGVSQATVHLIVAEKRWRHTLPGATLTVVPGQGRRAAEIMEDDDE